MNGDNEGVWTIEVRGGPAFWSNVMAVLEVGVSASSITHDGPSAQVYRRMQAAEAAYEPKGSVGING